MQFMTQFPTPHCLPPTSTSRGQPPTSPGDRRHKATVLLLAAALVTLASCGGSSPDANRSSGSDPLNTEAGESNAGMTPSGSTGKIAFFSGPDACGQLLGHLREIYAATRSAAVAEADTLSTLPGRLTAKASSLAATSATASPVSRDPGSIQSSGAGIDDNDPWSLIPTSTHSGRAITVGRLGSDIASDSHLWSLVQTPSNRPDGVTLRRLDVDANARLAIGHEIAWTLPTRTVEAPVGLLSLGNGRLLAVTLLGHPAPAPVGSDLTPKFIPPTPYCEAGDNAYGDYYCYQTTRIRLIDGHDPLLRTDWQVDLPGAATAIRLAGDQLQLVSHSQARIPRVDAPQTAPLDQWLLPLNPGRAPTPELCSSFARVDTPPGSGALGFTQLQAVDLTARTVHTETLVALATPIATEPNALILETDSRPDGAQARWTSILHRFAINESNRLGYQSSQVLDGLVNAISVTSERNIRVVATTLGDDFWRSHIAAYRTEGATDAWQRVWRLDLDRSPPGGTPASARFIGSRAFLAGAATVPGTRVYNVASATGPVLLGELAGVSHVDDLIPLSEDRLLHAPIVKPGQPWPLQIIDAADPARSSVVGTLMFTATNGLPRDVNRRLNEIARLHQRSDSDKAVLALALDSNAPATGLALVSASPYAIDATALTLDGVLDLTDLLRDSDPYAPRTTVRSVIAGDLIYGIARLGTRSARLTAPAVPLSTVLYPDP